MVRQRITLIGTGCIGTAIGLALHATPDAARLEIVGHDKEPDIARQAQRLGALDHADFNLDLALREAKLIVVAVPLAALREVLADLGRLLPANSGAVVTAIAPLLTPTLTWAAELLPAGTYFVGGNVFLAPGAGGWEPLHGPESARADLFHEALYGLVARSQEHPSAVKAVTNLARVLGAEPFFVDPAEHDAVSALATALPALTATALFQATAAEPGWGELRKVADRSFATATAAADGDAPSYRMLALLGREPLLAGLEGVLARLGALRELVAQGEAEALEEALAETTAARRQWMVASRLRSWEVEPGGPSPTSVFQLTLQALVGGLAGRGAEEELPPQGREGWEGKEPPK